MAPSTMQRCLFGMIRSGSKTILNPSPLHSSQAPKGELNENIRGWSSSKARPQTGQAIRDEYIVSPPSSPTTITSPSARLSAFSTASTRRERSGVSSRSITISMSCFW